MKDAIDIVQDVRSLINVDAITSQISGKIWPFVRPNNRGDKIDIVIGVLNANNEQIQESDVNIRIHAPNKQTNIEGTIQQYPLFSTLKNVTAMVLPFVESQYRPSFFTEVSIPGDIIPDSDGTYFSLIRVTYRSIQDNYKNI